MIPEIAELTIFYSNLVSGAECAAQPCIPACAKCGITAFQLKKKHCFVRGGFKIKFRSAINKHQLAFRRTFAKHKVQIPRFADAMGLNSAVECIHG